MAPTNPAAVQRSFLRYQHFFVFAAPVLFVLLVLTAAPTPSDAGLDYWLEYWWLFFFFLLGATIVNTVGISGSAMFVPFLIFVFPLLAYDLEPETIVKIGLISESFGLSSSAVAFVQYGLVDRRLGLSLVAGSIPFVVGGALLSFYIPEPLFHGALAVALLGAAYLLFSADLAHEGAEDGGEGDGSAGTDDSSTAAEGSVDDSEPPAGATDGGAPVTAGSDGLPDDDGKLGPAGVGIDEEGTVTRVDRDGDAYSYTWSGYLERFANYSVGGAFQGLAGFGIGELGIISMLRTNVPVRVAIGTNHVVVALTAILASLVHVFAGDFLPGAHSLSLASTPWNMVVFTVPATTLGGQIAPYVSNALDTDTITMGVAGLFSVISVALFLMAVGV
jgi:uncharacterized membrane protein YfcA